MVSHLCQDLRRSSLFKGLFRHSCAAKMAAQAGKWRDTTEIQSSNAAASLMTQVSAREQKV